MNQSANMAVRNATTRAGFTLIELTLVVLGIAILIAMVAMGYGKVREMADVTKSKLRLSEIQKGITAYKGDLERLPPSYYEENYEVNGEHPYHLAEGHRPAFFGYQILCEELTGYFPDYEGSQTGQFPSDGLKGPGFTVDGRKFPKYLPIEDFAVKHSDPELWKDMKEEIKWDGLHDTFGGLVLYYKAEAQNVRTDMLWKTADSLSEVDSMDHVEQRRFHVEDNDFKKPDPRAGGATDVELKGARYLLATPGADGKLGTEDDLIGLGEQ